ncbi:MAG: hypothetical protein ACXADY_01275 [Candidatus Hodarchaeales archaeon]|jgi:translation initiation factor 2B subunit (eIF-2B alpha/beta/delta family)
MLSKSFFEDLEKIHNDTQSGAARIAENCLQTFERECIQLGSKLDKTVLKTAIKLLIDTHPMASIENALLPIYLRLTQHDGLQKEDTVATIELIFTQRREQMKIGEKNTIETLNTILQDKKTILTFSHSSTVTTALLQLAGAGYSDKEIYLLESRPLREGERTALSLANAGFKKIHLGIDFAVNEFSRLAEVAVLGADIIHPNGQVLNKMGSATIANLFHIQSKEVIVAASLTKIFLRGIINHDHDWHPVIPHRNPKEITTTSSPNLIIWNKYFEIIQPEFISSLIMDRHQFSSPISIRLKEFLEQDIAISSYLETLRELRNDADFTTI